MNPDVLYQNRKHYKLHQRIQKSYEMHKAKPLPAEFKPRLDGPSSNWKIFKRLQMATSYADTCTKDCMVFSFEEKLPESSGQRLFLVAHPTHMWLNHRSRPSEERCTYEVIREGFPCKLYFDLEYLTSCNPDSDGIMMTDILIRCVFAAMQSRYKLKLQKSDVLWLDGSIEQKYSCHLIFQMHNVAFKNNIQAGLFVSAMLSKIKEQVQNNTAEDLWPSVEELKTLFVKTKSGKISSFCDDGVYTKNRNFRLYLSTKLGKKAPLIVSKFNSYKPKSWEKYKTAEEYIYYNSLITYFGNDKNIETFLSWTEESILKRQPTKELHRVKMDKESFTGCALSPFPNLDNFILGVVRDDFIVGFIRKWTYFLKEQIIIYDIGNYRFCQNIGRHHKSNNIRILVHFKEKSYYQKCYDPECQKQNFSSSANSVPDFALSLNIPDDFFNDNCFSQLENTNAEATNITARSDEITENKIDGVYTDDNSVDYSFFEDLNEDSEFSQLPAANNFLNSRNKHLLQTGKLNIMHDKDDVLQEVRSAHVCGNSSIKLESEASGMGHIDDYMTETVSFNLPETFWEEEIPDCNTGNLCGSDISDGEEMIMAEAAAAVEATTNNLFSEETIF